MSAAVCGKRASSFFEELPHSPSSPPSKRARFRGGSSPHRPLADPALVANIRAQLPSVGLEFIEKALEDCENDLDSALKCLLDLHVGSTEYNVDPFFQSPSGMSTELQVPDEGISVGNETAAQIGNAPSADNFPSSSTQWVEILVNEMTSASNVDDAKSRASRVLEVFEKSMISRVGAEAMESFQKVTKQSSVYKEQFEAVAKENTILKKAVAIQHERQKENDEKNQELQQLKQLVVQYQEQVRSLEVNNYALSMHLRQAQQGNSIPGHFHRDIF
uniref:CUE domain-containing protein n=1 Tax=Leersia perrieri TaxID=77586 RepID=A0A0D9XBA4_9ORYZ